MEKQLIPQLRFSSFKGSDFSLVKFGSVIKDSGYGPRFNGNDYDVNGNVKTIRGTDISLDGEIKYNQVPIANLDETFVKNHILKDGDLVMITTADCGLTGVFRKQDIDFIPSAYAVKISLKETASPIYFKYFFQTSIAKNQINRFVRKATVANLPGSDIPKLNINIPPLPEQQKIAKFLTDVDDKITKLTKKKELLEQYKKGVMQKIFNQELRFKDDEGNEFPNWEVKKLGDICELHHGYQFRSTDFTKEGLAVIKISNVIGSQLNLDDITFIDEKRYDEFKRFEILNGDILMSLTGNIGRVIEVNRKPFTLIQNYRVGKFEPFDKNVLIKPFLKYLLVSDLVFGRFNQLSNQSAQANFGKQDMNKITVQFPTTLEQTKIANFLSDIDLKIEVLNTKIENSKTFKRGLLQQMFV